MTLARKQIYKKCFVVLICLLIVGNSAHGAVLCFGSDGHIEIESTFHERCTAQALFQMSGRFSRNTHDAIQNNPNTKTCPELVEWIINNKLTDVGCDISHHCSVIFCQYSCLRLAFLKVLSTFNIRAECTQ